MRIDARRDHPMLEAAENHEGDDGDGIPRALLSVRDALCDLQSAHRFFGEALIALRRVEEGGVPRALADGATVVLDLLGERGAALLVELDRLTALERHAVGADL